LSESTGRGGEDFRGASVETLKLRAGLLARARDFFSSRGILEVETPLLSRGVVVDRHLDPPVCRYGSGGAAAEKLYLQTSPEAAMKRLLAAGLGASYQVAHSFREGERGRLHNPEFTIIEWYRPGLDHHELMDEVGALVSLLLPDHSKEGGWEKLSYRQLFRDRLGIDPLECGAGELGQAAEKLGVEIEGEFDWKDRDAWLDLLLSTRLQEDLGVEGPVFLYDYPASQAALARLCPDEPRLAERFELYIGGIELCNGYHELLDADEQRSRFEKANEQRRDDGREPLEPDEKLLRALESGMPECSGVALGFDRLVMLAVGADSIDEVLAFPFEDV
jgi:lysyl-tRNA synthetase class 2